MLTHADSSRLAGLSRATSSARQGPQTKKHLRINAGACFFWGGQRDLNPRMYESQSYVLTASPWPPQAVCQKPADAGFELYGGAEQDRTVDLLNAIQALSQLSYSPTCHVTCNHTKCVNVVEDIYYSESAPVNDFLKDN